MSQSGDEAGAAGPVIKPLTCPVCGSEQGKYEIVTDDGTQERCLNCFQPV